MENLGARAAYVKRLSRVLAHMYDHLDEELDLDRLADVAALSPHHWHRIYHALHGETAAATVKRLRLQRAAADRPVFEIYLNSPQDTAPSDLLCDLRLPLKPLAGEAS